MVQQALPEEQEFCPELHSIPLQVVLPDDPILDISARFLTS